MTSQQKAGVDVLQWIGDERYMYGVGTESRAKCEAVHSAVAELIEAAQQFSELYGHLWDLVEPNGAGFLSPESVVKYDEAHETLSAALARVQGGP